MLFCDTRHHTHIQREGWRKGDRDKEKGEPPQAPMIPWVYFTNTPKMPGKPIVVPAPSRSFFGCSVPSRSNRNIHLARKEKMFLSVVLPAGAKGSIVPAGCCVACQGHASLPFTGSFEDTQRAAVVVAGPQGRLAVSWRRIVGRQGARQDKPTERDTEWDDLHTHNTYTLTE